MTLVSAATEWSCVIACLESIAKEYNINVTQEEIIQQVKQLNKEIDKMMNEILTLDTLPECSSPQEHRLKAKNLRSIQKIRLKCCHKLLLLKGQFLYALGNVKILGTAHSAELAVDTVFEGCLHEVFRETLCAETLRRDDYAHNTLPHLLNKRMENDVVERAQMCACPYVS